LKVEPRGAGRLANGAIGAVVAVYAFLDDLILGPILVGLTLWVPWFLTLGVSAGALTFLNIGCCNWLQRSWDTWIRGHGAALEAKLEQLRRGRLLRHPLHWITRDSDVWLTIAAGLIGTVIVVAVTRLAGAAPVGRRRIVFASAAYSIGFAATYTGVGVGLDDLLKLV
jgi:hypothetical protein